MWMEFQGKKATHDFFSLYTKDSSFQLQDSMPASQGFYLKTHDFLKPLEKAGEPEPARRAGPTDRATTVAHVLPGGIGTYSISHVAENTSAAEVKPEVVTCGPGPGPGPGPGLGSKPEADSGNGPSGAVAFTLWEASSASAAAKDNGNRGQWSSPFAACATASFGSLSSSRNQPAQDKTRFVESESRSSRGFDEEDEDDDEFGKREGTSKKVDLTVKVDGRGGNDQKATTPRSKHSATEQRRRSKINDRFQILKELIPHSDQKRDKASFLLEVIEYIWFLQEKVQKYESSYPGWTDKNAKLMPWNNSQVSRDGTAAQIIKNDHAPGFMYSVDDNRVPGAPGVLSTAQHPIESDMSAGASYKAMENPVGFTNKISSATFPSRPTYASVERGTGAAQPQQRLISDIDNMDAQSQSQWLRPSGPGDYSVSSDMLNEQEELTIDEGTISVSTAYSQNILNTLNQALENSGIDLSQANISVQINMGKRATSRRATATTISSAKDLDDPLSRNQPVIGHSRVGSNREESEQAPKRRRKSDNN